MKFIIIFALLFSLTTFSQKIEGAVFDKATNEPLQGVSIHLMDENSGVATDKDGKFILRVNKKDMLVFAHIGYTTQEISAAKFKENGLVIYLDVKVAVIKVSVRYFTCNF